MIEIPINIINIDGDGFHIVTEGFINGRTARFVVDTGASRTVFDKDRILNYTNNPEFAEKEGLSAGIGGTDISSFIFTIENLCFGDLKINDYQAVAMDLSNINTSYEMIKLPPIDGVLGGDLLRKHNAVISYRLKKIRLFPTK
ncbi:MAG: clan AA aspartic protease [Bacteroidales bacterium]|nr:clan AA aspartic protease [Bacteroidales bacterium]MBR5780673.1 clan AA aspartic protease [Bacteroidales bacterium]